MNKLHQAMLPLLRSRMKKLGVGFTMTALSADEVTLNGRYYPRHVLEDAVKQCKKLLTIFEGAPDHTSSQPHRIIGVVDEVSMHGRDLVVTGSMDTEHAKAVHDGSMVLRPTGTGKIAANGTVTEYSLNGLCWLPAPAPVIESPPFSPAKPSKPAKPIFDIKTRLIEI